MISSETTWLVYSVLVAVFILQLVKIWHVNAEFIKNPVPEQSRYHFKQVAIL
ncbi:MAG TPA: MFS transporter, partial [Gammaproteobacteria bacterium]|nr:MFS transporter [Gammaproteobacteria bacterium]